MTDVFTKIKRSDVMSKIRGKGNVSTEMRLIKLMREHRITGWRRNHQLPGRPDFVFRRQHVAVFIDGCFWHGCPKHYSEPASATDFWRTKIEANRRRDRRVGMELKRRGWLVLRLWEHDLKRLHSARAISRLRGTLAVAASRIRQG